MKILFTTAEVAPFAKSGGLGDVAGSLPQALSECGMETRVIMPLYESVAEKYGDEMEQVDSIQVVLGWRTLYCGLKRMMKDGICYYFVDNQYYFYRNAMYGYADDAERFAFFSKAVLECIMTMTDFKPDVIHCNDWHTALVPIFKAEFYGAVPYFADMGTVFTIHNLKYQGDMETVAFDDVLGLSGHVAAWEQLEFNGRLNLMKGGIMSASKVTTVSPSYAEEIKEIYWSEGLGEVIRLRQQDLIGILNGILYKSMPFCRKNKKNIEISKDKLKKYKKEKKREIQSAFNLPIRPDVPLFAMVSRLEEQKGLDLLECILHEFLAEDVQIVFLGTGAKRYEDMVKGYDYAYPEKVGVKVAFDLELAETIYGGADLFLMPSKFEPCGLSQMEAMRCGTLPVVREVGGLKDSVKAYNELTGEGNGFSFANYNAHELLQIMRYAVRTYKNDKEGWEKLLINAASEDFGWKNSAMKYKALYEEIVPDTTD